MLNEISKHQKSRWNDWVNEGKCNELTHLKFRFNSRKELSRTFNMTNSADRAKANKSPHLKINNNIQMPHLNTISTEDSIATLVEIHPSLSLKWFSLLTLKTDKIYLKKSNQFGQLSKNILKNSLLKRSIEPAPETLFSNNKSILTQSYLTASDILLVHVTEIMH